MQSDGRLEWGDSTPLDMEAGPSVCPHSTQEHLRRGLGQGRVHAFSLPANPVIGIMRGPHHPTPLHLGRIPRESVRLSPLPKVPATHSWVPMARLQSPCEETVPWSQR